MKGNEKIILLKEEITKHGLTDLSCNDIDEFICFLKIIESFDDITMIPGITINKADENDNLNEGETLSDFHCGEVSHYCAKVDEGDIFINNSKLESWANELFITESGRPNYNNISIMRKNGFNVGPGEADSFGWLTGVITTKKGKLVFG